MTAILDPQFGAIWYWPRYRLYFVSLGRGRGGLVMESSDPIYPTGRYLDPFEILDDMADEIERIGRRE